MSKCEMCWDRQAKGWFLVDQDYEAELCGPCSKELQKEVTVEPIGGE